MSAVLLGASTIYSGSSASGWTAKQVRSSGQYPSKPKLPSSIFSAPWDRLALCSCSSKTVMRQQKSKSSQLAFIPCSWATANTNWKAGLKLFAAKNQVAALRNQNQFTESYVLSVHYMIKSCFFISHLHFLLRKTILIIIQLHSLSRELALTTLTVCSPGEQN